MENVANNLINHNQMLRYVNGLPVINVYNCFDVYTLTKITEDNNPSYCQYCLNNMKQQNKVDLYKLPEYLIVVLSKGKNGTYRCNLEVNEFID